MERYRDEHASDLREVLLLDDTFYPINTCLAVGQATHSLWQRLGFHLAGHQWRDAWLLGRVSLAQVNDVSC